ncbi:MFS transporter [Nonomuraea turkmeniaca]|uniref:MFS transporter n=1 Tax=Nonomuraea turkmeniaca TaxID=103838 RepID=A0A5S4FSG9_9ACTN|nr:MFS transporter [Nonomuraea turkmeniaca]TMR23314.1 MFS transporter [Nonomuraea turkmeniaca]
MTGNKRWLALAVVLTAAFMDNVDATIVSVALPRIQRELGADATAAQWILAGYALTFALLLITGGRLGDIAGRKRVFLAGVAGFTLASIVAGTAQTPGVLVAACLGQGAMAALMVPQVMSVIVALFRPEERALPFSLMGAVLSAGSVCGPLLGGLLTEYDLAGLSWRAVFLLNVPIGLATFAAAARFMPETRSAAPLRLDLAGVALAALAALGIMYPLLQRAGYAWMVLGVVMAFAFAAQQRRRGQGRALVPPELFGRRSFTMGVVVVLLVFSGVTSFFFVLSYHLQLDLGWSPLDIALVMLAWPAGITATSHLALRRGVAWGRSLIGTGAAAMGVGMLLMLLFAQAQELTWAHVVAAELVMGLGMGMCVPVLTTVALGDVPADDAGAGAGVVNTGIQLGTALGVAIVGGLYFTAGTAALWYNVAVFALAALLSPLLSSAPRAAKAVESAARP